MEKWKRDCRLHRARSGQQDLFGGQLLKVLIADDVLILDDKAVDLDKKIGQEGCRIAMRLVGIPTLKGHCYFLTHTSPQIGPWQVGDIYRVRWEVELSIKLGKCINRLLQTRGTNAKTMRHAGMTASIITAIQVNRHHPATRPRMGAVREVAPLHPMQVARVR
jgi:hypothetical protein